MVRSCATWSVALLVLACAAGPAAADDAVLQKLLDRLDGLERQNRALQERLDKLEKKDAPPAELPPPKEKPPADDKPAGPKKDDAPKKDEPVEYEVGTQTAMTGVWNNGLQFRSADDSFKLHAGGRVDFDNTFFTQDPDLRFGTDDNSRLVDGSDFRRLRLRVDGSFWENTDFVFEVNFANFQDFANTDQFVTIGSVGITDMNLTFRDLPVVGNARVGHFQPPIGLEHISSSNYWMYMERSPQFDAFINRFDYVNGLMVFDTLWGDRATWAGSVMRTGSRTVNPFGAGGGDGEYGLAFRTTALPVDEDDGRRLVHVGFAYLQRALDGNATSPGDRALVRGGAGREIPNVLQTGTIFAPGGVYYLNGELAFVNGPWSLSGEYLAVLTPTSFRNRSPAGVYSDPRGSLFYQGGYVESGYFLTPGDYRRYNRKQGAWDRVVPVQNGYVVRGDGGRPVFGRGAVQLLMRYSYLDLASGQPTFTPTTGARAGQENDLTVGLNWYLNPQAVVMVNYVRTYIDSVLPTASGSFNGLGFRFHYDF